MQNTQTATSTNVAYLPIANGEPTAAQLAAAPTITVSGYNNPEDIVAAAYEYVERYLPENADDFGYYILG